MSMHGLTTYNLNILGNFLQLDILYNFIK